MLATLQLRLFFKKIFLMLVMVLQFATFHSIISNVTFKIDDVVTLAVHVRLMYVLFYLVDRPCSLFVVGALSESSSF